MCSSCESNFQTARSMLNDRRGGGGRLINKSAPFIGVAVIAGGQIRNANYKGYKGLIRWFYINTLLRDNRLTSRGTRALFINTSAARRRDVSSHDT